MSNEDIIRLLPDSQICVLEVSPVTADSFCKNPNITAQTMIIKNRRIHFVRSTALMFLQAGDNDINVRWNGIYKLLIRNDELWFTKYQETHDYLCETLELMKPDKEKHYIGW